MGRVLGSVLVGDQMGFGLQIGLLMQGLQVLRSIVTERLQSCLLQRIRSVFVVFLVRWLYRRVGNWVGSE